MSRLDELVDVARSEVRRRRDRVSLEELTAQLRTRGDDRPFKEALVMPGISLIAEFKRRSPSAGEIRPGAEVADLVPAYERGGAAALSILTEDGGFGGSLEDLRAARAVSELPLLRKDFVVDEYQLLEARAAGADAVLLIVAALDQPALIHLQSRARDLGLAALVEVHDEHELSRACEGGARVIGVNNRNLRTLAVDVEASYRLAALMPADVIAVSESGLHSRAEVDRLAGAGYSAFLIGERFMTDPEPAQAIGVLVRI